MKVLWKAQKSIQVKCEHCGSILEIKEKDLFRDEYLDFAFKCPVCENDTNITEEEQEILIFLNKEY